MGIHANRDEVMVRPLRSIGPHEGVEVPVLVHIGQWAVTMVKPLRAGRRIIDLADGVLGPAFGLGDAAQGLGQNRCAALGKNLFAKNDLLPGNSAWVTCHGLCKGGGGGGANVGSSCLAKGGGGGAANACGAPTAQGAATAAPTAQGAVPAEAGVAVATGARSGTPLLA